MDFDYKKYSLENLENWLHDAISCSEASPQEIYNVIKGVIREEYYIYKNHTERCSELLELLNGHRPVNFDDLYDDVMSEKEYYEPSMPPWGHSDLEYLAANSKKDKVTKWVLPVQLDGLTGDCVVNLPDDLLEAANLKEGDQIEWVDRGDGSYLLKKVEKISEKVSLDSMTWDQAMESGWSMTADGFWIKEN